MEPTITRIWTETASGDFVSSVPGMVIVRQIMFRSGPQRYALYTAFPNSVVATGKCLCVGTLDECKEKATEYDNN